MRCMYMHLLYYYCVTDINVEIIDINVEIININFSLCKLERKYKRFAYACHG